MQFSTLAALSLLGLSQAAIVTEVVYATAYEYQNVDVIVDQDGNPYTTVIENVSTGEGAAAPAPTSTSTASVETSSYVAPSTSSEAAPSPSTTTSEAPAPVTTSEAPAPAPTTSTSTSEAPAPAPSSHSHTEVYNYNYITAEASSSSTSEYVAPTTTSTTEAAPSTTTSEAPASTTASSGGSGGQFSGDATYYSPGLGACGETNSDSDFIAALNVDQFNGFGAMSNGNPVCGKKATISYNGKSTTVTITDKCPGCSYGDLDLSPAAFQALADESLGRIKITWSFD